jgi:glucose/arabinose dehydrogenase
MSSSVPAGAVRRIPSLSLALLPLAVACTGGAVGNGGAANGAGASTGSGAVAESPAASAGGAPRSPTPATTDDVVRGEVVARGLEHPWALAFLPDGRALVTERPGRLRVVATDGTLSPPVQGVPTVAARGQGGLLDVALAPDFATSRRVYLSFAEPGEGNTAGTAVARGRLSDDARSIADLQVIYRQQPKVAGGNHFGSRLVFAADGMLYVTQGDRFDYREQAQDPQSLLGKVVRLNADGTVPRDNPFVGRQDVRPETWSTGHRNVQAAALDPATGRLWTIEHGARGGDELNAPERGKNYGWPTITYGVDYSGAKIGEGTAKPGLEQPVYYWDPVIAPSGATFYTGDAIPGWRGSLLVGSLNPGALVRLEMRDGRVVREERFLKSLGSRIRDVQQGPDGFVYVVTDARDGQLVRVRPR